MNERQLALDLSPRQTAVAYMRSSTLKQPYSIEVQRIQISKWANDENTSVVSWHEDVGVSGAKRMSKRPGMTEALNFLSATGSQFLVVSHGDRLARDVDVANEIEAEVRRLGASVVYAEQLKPAGAYGDLMRGVIDAFADYSRDLVVERTKAALKAKRDRGERTGSVPLGCATADDGKTLVSDAGEAATVARVLELRASGVSLVKIAARLDAEGHRPRGSRWHATTVVNILKRAAVAGTRPQLHAF